MTSHSDGDLVGEFCTERSAKCSKHKEEYREKNCGVVTWRFQAHHVLCVAAVTQYLSADTKIKTIVEQTPWCINRKGNMLAMPDYMGTIYAMFTAWSMTPAASATPLVKPPFADIPVHGYNHGRYKTEIDNKMMEIADKVNKAKDKHDEASATLLSELNVYQGIMHTVLKGRGNRGAGTCVEWMKVYSGEKSPDSDWYVPFSMAAKGSIEPKTFPITGRVKSVVDAVKKLVSALL